MAEYLGISVNTVRSWVKRGRMPWVKINGAVRFDLLSIDIWVEENKREVLDETQVVEWAFSQR